MATDEHKLKRLRAVLEGIDAANRSDPNIVSVAGHEAPTALLYGQRMTDWLLQFAPDASAELQIAARGQHICRWEIPRSTYPLGRIGYLKWRTYLYGYHADKVGSLMRDAGYDESSLQRVRDLLSKKYIKKDREAQQLEDVVCLVFLAHYLSDFTRKYPEEKIISVIRKTWTKMSDVGHQTALTIEFGDALKPILSRALNDDEG